MGQVKYPAVRQVKYPAVRQVKYAAVRQVKYAAVRQVKYPAACGILIVCYPRGIHTGNRWYTRL